MGLAKASIAQRLHPIDVIERFITKQHWHFDRPVNDEISVAVVSTSHTYSICFVWLEHEESLHFSCSLPVEISTERAPCLQELLTQINAKLLIGHFDYWHKESVIMFRYGLLLGGSAGLAVEQIEQVLARALDCCESYSLAFNLVCQWDVSPQYALQYALFETEGNA